MGSRLCTLAVGLVLMGTFACDSGPAPKPQQASKQPPAATPEPAAKTAKAAEPAPAPEPKAVEPPPPEVIEAPAEPTPDPDDGAWKRPADITDPRDPRAIPPDTPAANAASFERMPVAKGDKPPIGGIGKNGIHLDELEIGKGWHKSRCDLVGDSFVVEDKKVNVCMRVIHRRGEAEELTIHWMRDGKLNQRSKVKVSEIHAYLTRGYLPITEARKGEWTAQIKTADDTVLGEVTFAVN